MIRYPGEWTEQKATWLSYPHNENEWKDKLPGIKEFYKSLINIILDFQDVNLIFPNEEMLNDVETLRATSLRKKHKLHRIIIPNNDVWIRDYGPFFLKQKNVIARKGKALTKQSPNVKQDEIASVATLPRNDMLVVDFEFNAWGGKFPPWDLDNNVPKNIALYMGEKCESYPIILEGGAIDFNGDDLAITTEECLLNKNRNPNVSKKQIENIIKDVFNIKEIIWLKRGLEGDHTDGHVDNVARFIGENKIVVNKGLETKSELLKWVNVGACRGKPFEIFEVPLPDVKHQNKKLPASYVNFIFVNGGIILPVFNVKTDSEAIKLFKRIFPDRKIVSVDCSLLIQEGGGLHCITKQEPLI